MKTSFNNITSKELLLAVELPVQTNTYKPITHLQIIEDTLEGINRSSMILTKEQYFTGAKGNQMLGRYGLQLDGNPEIGIQIAFHNSYDKSLSLKYAVGEHVFICSNGSVSGSYDSFKSKHMGQIQQITPVKIAEFLDGCSEQFQGVLKRKARFEQIEITKKTCAELLGRMYVEEEIINSAQLSIIKGELVNPSFDYKADGTLWQFWNGCTYALQESSPRNYIDKSLELFKFVEEEYA